MGTPVREPASLASTGRPRINRIYRLQWEEAQHAWVLLFPEGMVRLNGSAAEILKRCDGVRSTEEIVADLERAFAKSELAADVTAFLRLATDKGWVQWVDGSTA
jgi:pyrroloquinoline quinone biosynthesis protein D